MKALAVIAILGTTGVPAAFAQTNWTPYIADYTQTAVTTSANGKAKTMPVTNGKEERAANGSVLTTVVSNGKPVRGTLWDATTGHLININYTDKRALILRTVKRVHNPKLHPGSSLGVETVAGVTCTLFPNRPSNPADHGTGTICVDQQDDVVMKIEIHSIINGNKIDFTKTLTRINFIEPSPGSMTLPADVKLF